MTRVHSTPDAALEGCMETCVFTEPSLVATRDTRCAEVMIDSRVGRRLPVTSGTPLPPYGRPVPDSKAGGSR